MLEGLSMKKRILNYLDKLVYLFILIQPIIDIITAYQVRTNASISIGTIIRGIFFLSCGIYLLYKRNYKLICILGGYFILQLIYIFSIGSNLFTEINNLIRIFYLPITMYLFSNHGNKYINDKTFMYMYFIYLIMLVGPYFLGIGHSLSEIYPDKHGYIGYFYGGNEISAIIMCLTPITLKYIFKNMNIFYKVISIILLSIATIIVGTKTLLFGIILIGLYFGLSFIKSHLHKINTKMKLSIGGVIILFVILFGIIFPKTNVYQNFMESFKFYEINNISDLVTVENLDRVFLSARGTTIKEMNKVFFNDNKNIILGMSLSKVMLIKNIEIDFFDMFYSIGLIGSLVFVIIFGYLFFKNRLKGIYLFTLLLMILISFFSGHIIFTPCVSIYLAILFNKKYEE